MWGVEHSLSFPNFSTPAYHSHLSAPHPLSPFPLQPPAYLEMWVRIRP